MSGELPECISCEFLCECPPDNEDIAESIDDDEQLRVMSDLVGYRYFDETLNLLDGLENAPHEGYHRAKASFLTSLRA